MGAVLIIPPQYTPVQVPRCVGSRRSRYGAESRLRRHAHQGRRQGEQLHNFNKRSRISPTSIKCLLSWAFCRTCVPCSTSHQIFCDNHRALNLAMSRGSCGTTAFIGLKGDRIASNYLGQSCFSRHCIVDESSVILVPDSTTKEQLQLLSVLGCGQITGAGAVLNVLKPTQGKSCWSSLCPEQLTLRRRNHHRGLWHRSCGGRRHHGGGDLSNGEDHCDRPQGEPARVGEKVWRDAHDQRELRRRRSGDQGLDRRKGRRFCG